MRAVETNSGTLLPGFLSMSSVLRSKASQSWSLCSAQAGRISSIAVSFGTSGTHNSLSSVCGHGFLLSFWLRPNQSFKADVPAFGRAAA